MLQKSGTAFITGAARRVGAEVAITLAKAGFNIALHYNNSREDATKTAMRIRETGVKCELFQADLQDISSIPTIIDKVFSQFPNCNLLVNNASIFEKCDFAGTTPDIFDEYMNIHLKAPFFLTQEFAKRCKKGQIINIVDTYITKSSRNYFTYNLSKRALYDLTLMLARILAPDIRVNAVLPGILYPEDHVNIKGKTDYLPMKSLGNVEQVAEAIKYLATNKFLNGQSIFVDGGEHLL